MTREETDKLAMIAAGLYMQYGRQLLTIVGEACKKHDFQATGPLAAVCNDVQDHSFRLGLLAGMRLGENSPMKEFLEKQVAQIEKGQVSISRRWLNAAFHIPAEWVVISAAWDSAADSLKLCVMGEGVPLSVEVVEYEEPKCLPKA